MIVGRRAHAVNLRRAHAPQVHHFELSGSVASGFRLSQGSGGPP